MPKQAEEQYIVLPPLGMVATGLQPEAGRMLLSLNATLEAPGRTRMHTLSVGAVSAPPFQVLDSIHENGAKLISARPETLSALRAGQPGLRIVPVTYYYPAVSPRPALAKGPKTLATGAALKIKIRIVSAAAAEPLAGVDVVAFTDFQQREGAQGTTNSKGEVSLALGASSKKIERLYLFPKHGFWPGLRRSITLKSGLSLPLDPIDLSFTDCVRFAYGTAALSMGQGVKVGVLDTGVAAHPDLVIDGGRNTVTGENPADFGDNGVSGHGTHVAGIIAARGTAPKGWRGVAPGVTLRSYRVFGKGQKGASNFAIAKAIDAAVGDGCDLINMSLGGGPDDPATNDAIAAARAAGTLVFAANGNDYREPVSFPAAADLCLAVSAMGRKGTFPKFAAAEGDVAKPLGKDPKNFMAAFSNVGAATDLTGPGVGVISTVPGNAYEIMDGTSMACPAEVGAAARVLAGNPAILAMPRNQARSDAMAGAVLQTAKPLGFGPLFEGQGRV